MRHGELHAQDPDKYDENDREYPDFALKKPPCPHLTGNAWMLNHNEGSAWITRFTKGEDKPEDPDWVFKFEFCPCCGERLQASDDKTLKASDAQWDTPKDED